MLTAYLRKQRKQIHILQSLNFPIEGICFINRNTKQLNCPGMSESRKLKRAGHIWVGHWPGIGKKRGLPGGARGNESACQSRRHKRRGFSPWVGRIPWRRACPSVSTDHAMPCLLSRVQLCNTWTVAHQAPLSTEFSRQQYWSGLPFSSPGNHLKYPLLILWKV